RYHNLFHLIPRHPPPPPHFPYTTLFRSRQLRHPRQMVIVVLGGEEGHVDHPHGLIQAGMEGGQADELLVPGVEAGHEALALAAEDRKSTRLNSSHVAISYAVFCLKKKKN